MQKSAALFTFAGARDEIIPDRPKKGCVDNVEAHHVRHGFIAEKPGVHRQPDKNGIRKSTHRNKTAAPFCLGFQQLCKNKAEQKSYNHAQRRQKKQQCGILQRVKVDFSEHGVHNKRRHTRRNNKLGHKLFVFAAQIAEFAEKPAHGDHEHHDKHGRKRMECCFKHCLLPCL